MTYSEQIRHPDGALNPPPDMEELKSKLRWWPLIGAVVVALFLIGKFRPQWLAKIGLHIPTGVGAVGNPMGWV